ncbi:hypothetical protein HCA99_13765 [Listeria booriae]|uniref:hypothetical protein n=1 Tax=Listeria booriae TaxID=1552123 RepID=UPI001623DA65|nr:hypothetical protein [Listeria booriae]MBC2080292.1 hypothetical protein [Listeria booriae]
MMIDPDGNIAWWVVAAGTGAFEGGVMYLLFTKKKTWRGFAMAAGTGALTNLGFGKLYRVSGSVAKRVQGSKFYKKNEKKLKKTSMYKKYFGKKKKPQSQPSTKSKKSKKKKKSRKKK